MTIADDCSAARASYSFDHVPTSVHTAGAGARADWTLRLEPHQTITIGVVCAYGDDALEAGAAAARAAQDFSSALASSEAGYRDLWRSMFTPGNPHFSGHLPTLRTTDQGLSRSYYMAALLALYMRNTRVSASEPVFLTGGPRLGPTTTFFWDHTEWSRLYALLEPAGLRSWLHRALSSPYDQRVRVRYAGTAARSEMTTPPTTTRCSGWSSTTSASPATSRSWTSRPAPRRCSTTSAGWRTAGRPGGPPRPAACWPTSARTRGRCWSACPTTSTWWRRLTPPTSA